MAKKTIPSETRPKLTKKQAVNLAKDLEKDYNELAKEIVEHQFDIAGAQRWIAERLKSIEVLQKRLMGIKKELEWLDREYDV